VTKYDKRKSGVIKCDKGGGVGWGWEWANTDSFLVNAAGNKTKMCSVNTFFSVETQTPCSEAVKEIEFTPHVDYKILRATSESLNFKSQTFNFNFEFPPFSSILETFFVELAEGAGRGVPRCAGSS
jgi:hypothetical protein